MMQKLFLVLTFAASVSATTSALRSTPRDPALEPAESYKIGVNDLLAIDLHDLTGPGTQTIKTTRVTERGMINLPMIGSFKAQGPTVAELEAAIQKAYRDAKIVANAQVKANVVE